MAIETILVEYLNKVLFGNEVWRYLAFLIALLVTYPLGKISIFIVNNVLFRWAKKTNIKFDDILINSLNPSINLFIFAGMFYFGSSFINQGQYSIVFDRIFNFLVIIPIVFFMIKLSTETIGYYMKKDRSKKKINEAAVDLLMKIIRISLFAIGILLIIANLGYNVSALLAGLGVGGLAFALAAQDILKNFFAGVSLIFDETFNKGERITFEGQTGFIEELKLRSTKVRTFDGTILTIPNAMLADNIVENVNKVPKVRVYQILGVTYDTSVTKLKKAKKIIKDAILEEERTEKENYWIWFDNFAAYNLEIHVIYYGQMTMDDWPDRAYFKERVNFKIKKEFEKAGIEFAFPTQTIEMKKESKKR
jgi:MscS family membrane protein